MDANTSNTHIDNHSTTISQGDNYGGIAVAINHGEIKQTTNVQLIYIDRSGKPGDFKEFLRQNNSKLSEEDLDKIINKVFPYVKNCPDQRMSYNEIAKIDEIDSILNKSLEPIKETAKKTQEYTEKIISMLIGFSDRKPIGEDAKGKTTPSADLNASEESWEQMLGVAQSLKRFKKYKVKVEKHEERARSGKRARRCAARDYFELGMCYAVGKKDYTEAVKWYSRAAELGYVDAYSLLGTCYFWGSGVEKNEAEAVKWYSKAAQKGDASAQNGLAVCYFEGRGVTENEAEAIKLWRKSADHGNTLAFYNLGECYEEGSGLPQSDKKAVKYYKVAAKQGVTSAQYVLGKAYESGRGVEESRNKAAKWYRKAAEHGDVKAQEALKKWGEALPEKIGGEETGSGIFAILPNKIVWWILTALVCVSSIGVTVLYWNGYSFLEFDSIWGWVFTVLFSIACLAFILYRLITSNGTWSSRIRSPGINIITDLVMYGVLLEGASGVCYGIKDHIVWLFAISMVGVGVVCFMYTMYVDSELKTRPLYFIANLVAMSLFAVCLLGGAIAFGRYRIYGDVLTVGQHHYMINKDGTLTFLMEDHNEEAIIIPSECNGKTVTGIESTGEGCPDLRHITIASSVISIGEGAFSGCSSLGSVTFEGDSQLTSIGEEAFSSCYSLTSITIPKGVTLIGKDAFNWCYKLVEVWNYSDLPITKGTSNYGNVANYAKRVYMTDETSKQMTTDDGYIFYEDGKEIYLLGYNGHETTLVFPDLSPSGKPYKIYDHAFWENDSLRSIKIPETVATIGSCAFVGCGSLKSVTFEDNGKLTSIEYMVFYRCSSLKSIVIPQGVTSIGSDVFFGCSSLTIYCETAEKPGGWDEDWNPNGRPVIWGYKGQS